MLSQYYLYILCYLSDFVVGCANTDASLNVAVLGSIPPIIVLSIVVSITLNVLPSKPIVLLITLNQS